MGGIKMKGSNDSIKWEDVWNLPLRKSDYDDYDDYVYSSNRVLALSYFKDEWVFDEMTVNKIVSIINGEINSDFHPKWEANGCEILYRGVYAFCVRGWGYLTGTGGLNLSKDIAKNLQDEFISYILSRLNNKPKID